jgi:NAD(P)-dependent dehydrogenase (short-subunit alcohol dehydrogenase family)
MLEGKTALVIGANGSIAEASATLLARDGATVVAMARRAEAAEAVKARIEAAVPGAQVIAHVGDTAGEEGVKAGVQAAYDVAGRLDIVIATVGGGGMSKLLDYDFARFREDFEINIYPDFLAVRYAAPLMKARGGAIVCVSSTAAVLAFDMLTAYCAGKAALDQFVRVAAEELGEYGIRVNAVRPGLTASTSTQPMVDFEAMHQRFLEQIPLGHSGEPMDQAEAIRFLAGPESKWLTGQSIAVDGGNELRRAPNVYDLVSGAAG